MIGFFINLEYTSFFLLKSSRLVLSTREGAKGGTRKELKKWARGSKLRKFFTSTKKLRSEATAAQLKAIDIDKQVASRAEAKSRGY